MSFTMYNPLIQYLKTVACILQPMGPRVLFYLAAAVSDFYIPWNQMVRLGPVPHKYPSSSVPFVCVKRISRSVFLGACFKERVSRSVFLEACF